MIIYFVFNLLFDQGFIKSHHTLTLIYLVNIQFYVFHPFFDIFQH